MCEGIAGCEDNVRLQLLESPQRMRLCRKVQEDQITGALFEPLDSAVPGAIYL